MKTYKTLEGFLKSSTKGKVCKYLRICDILNNNSIKFELQGKALNQFAELVSNYLYSGKTARLDIKNAIIRGCNDKNEYLQCFYLSNRNGKFYVSNSLSGEAFEYCRRKFYKTL